MSDAAIVLALQDADFKLLQLRKHLEELSQPQQILDVRAKIAEIRAKAKKVLEMHMQRQRTLSLLTDEQAIVQRKLGEVQAKLNAGTDYKETAALSAEIESLARRISKLEDDALEQMEKLEKVAAVTEQLAEALGKLEAQERQLTEDYRQQGGAINAGIAHEQQRRKELFASLPSAIAERYEKALLAKGGIAAAHLEGDHCSACHVSFSAGQLLKFKGAAAAQSAGDSICECPHCHRLLVVSQ